MSGELPGPPRVYEALDAEGEHLREDSVESVGTRHRAAYRFALEHPPGLAIVVSHDGAIRFVANCDGSVLYWEQFTAG